MKQINMVRTNGRKKLYFTDVKTCARFIRLYKDLFIGGWFKVNKLITSRGDIWELIFTMNHKDMNNIREALGTSKKSFAVKEGYQASPYRYTREFVEA